MSTKGLKLDFHIPARQLEKSVDAEPPESTPEESGCYPRSLHIIDFVLTNLFETGYLIPHIDKIRLEDSANLMTAEEMQAVEDMSAESLAGKKIERIAAFHDPEFDYCFEFNGLDDWSPFEVTLCTVDQNDETIDKEDAHDSVRAAINEFMDDLSMATTNVSHVRVNREEGTIQANNPLALFQVVRDMITWRNEEAALAEEGLKDDNGDRIDSDHPRFPMEFRPIHLPQYGYDEFSETQDADAYRPEKIEKGHNFIHEEDTEELALHNIPPRVYSHRADLYLAAYDMKERLEFRNTMVRLDEMEAIIRQETGKERSYASNPLLNLH